MSAGTLNLGGTVTLGSGWTRTGGVVNLIGTLENTGKTLVLDDSTGSLTLVNNGVIRGGTIQGSGSGKLLVQGGYGNALDGVTLNADVVSQNWSLVAIVGGMTFNGTWQMPSGGNILASGTETLQGNGRFQMSGGTFYLHANVPHTVTLGSGLTIAGSGSIDRWESGHVPAFVNQGTIAADVAGLSLQINNVNLTNSGTFQVAGGTLNLAGSMTTSGLGTWSRSGGIVNFTGTLVGDGPALLLGAGTTGSWNLSGATLRNLRVETDGAAILKTTGSSTLDGVTLAGRVEVNSGYDSRLRVLNGLVLDGGEVRITSNYAALSLEGGGLISTTGQGRGTVTMEAESSRLWVTGTGAIATLGPSLVVQGRGYIEGRDAGISLVNQGTIRANTTGRMDIYGLSLTNSNRMEVGGGTLNISASTWANTTGGVLAVSGTGVADLQSASWTNAGTMQISGGTLNLGGTTTTSGLGTWSRTGGTVNLKGTLTGDGPALALAAGTTGSWNLSGATLRNLRIESDGAAVLRTTGNSTLDNVTVAGRVEVNHGDYRYENSLRVVNGLVLDGGEVRITSDWAALAIEGGQVSGTGTIQMAAANSRLWVLGSGASVVLGGGVTVEGTGYIEGWNGGTALVNQGVIRAATTGRLTISVGQFTNSNWMEVGAGNTDVFSANFTNSGHVEVTGGTLKIAGWLANAGTVVVTGGTCAVPEVWANTGTVTVLGASGQARIGETVVKGKALPVSNTEIAFNYGQIEDPAYTLRIDDAVNGGQPDELTGGLRKWTYFHKDLEPGSVHALRAVATNAQGGQVVVDPGAVEAWIDTDRLMAQPWGALQGAYRVTLRLVHSGPWMGAAPALPNATMPKLEQYQVEGYESPNGSYDTRNWNVPQQDISAGSSVSAIAQATAGLVPLEEMWNLLDPAGGVASATAPMSLMGDGAELSAWGGSSLELDAEGTGEGTSLPFPLLWHKVHHHLVTDLGLNLTYGDIWGAASSLSQIPEFNPVPPNGWLFAIYAVVFDFALPAITKAVQASWDPVRYHDGAVVYDTTDLQSTGFGKGFGVQRSWTATDGLLGGEATSGTGMIQTGTPSMLQMNGDRTITISLSGSTSAVFTRTGDPGAYSYVPKYGDPGQLVHVGSEFVYTDHSGGTMRFYDFSAADGKRRGKFIASADAAGNSTRVHAWTVDGKIQEIRRGAAGQADGEAWLYTYLPAGDANAGKLASVAWHQCAGDVIGSKVRSVGYTYYGPDSVNGGFGDLRTATISDGAGNAIDTKYYRYYRYGQVNGYNHGLKYVVDARSYARIIAQYGNADAVSDAELAGYATHYFEYDARRRCTRHDVQGFGGEGSPTAGVGSSRYAYFVNVNRPSDWDTNPEVWNYKTVETLPDGNQNVVYCNASGEVLLNVFRNLSDPGNPSLEGKQWGTFYRYDGKGHTLWKAVPDAVVLPDDLAVLEAYPDLLNKQNGNYYYLTDAIGSIVVATYTPAGYVEDALVQQGELGTVVPVSRSEYAARTVNGATIYLPAVQTIYAGANRSEPRTTTYTYEWYANTFQPSRMTATLPVVSAAQNGSGAAVSLISDFDVYGNLAQTIDGGGYRTAFAYDLSSGAVTSRTEDVDGLHLVTGMEVDALGRTTKLTTPEGRITYTVYKDVAHEVRVYAGWDVATGRPLVPTAVAREDRAGNYDETLSMAVAPSLVGGVPDGGETIEDVQSLTREYYNNADQVVRTDRYFSFSGLSYASTTYIGTQDTHYYSTTLRYDLNGNVDQVVSPTGTITRTMYDGLQRDASVWVGTTLENLTKVVGNEYDGNGVGTGNLTQVTQYPGGNQLARATRYLYDWRGRLVSTKNGVQGTEDEGTNRPLTVLTYNNLDEVTASALYDGDTVALTDANADGIPDGLAASRRRGYAETSYDALGRAYQAKQYAVDQGTGALGTALTANTWYDPRGNVAKMVAPGGLVSKSSYDGAGRLAAVYQGDGGGDAGYADALNVTGDTVLEQREFGYDGDGNVIFSTLRQRFHNATGTGALGSPGSTTQPKARVYYSASWYDKAGRVTEEADLGTNGGVAYTRPAAAPARSDTALVSSYGYDLAGLLTSVQDAKGIVGRTFYDGLGRVRQTVENYVDGVPSNGDDQTTEFAYDGADHLLTRTANLPGGAFQATRYVYGASPARGDGIHSNDVLVAVQYPDKASGNPSAGEQESYTVDGLGETVTRQDRNGSVHSYRYDVLGRVTADTVSTLGMGVDGSVRRLGYTFNALGLGEFYTSYSDTAGTAVVNQVKREYNGLGLLTAEYQTLSGAVNTASTPKVGYGYDLAKGGRLTSVTYPNGRVIGYSYGTGVNDAIGRLSSIVDGSTTLESYSYLGLGTVVERNHPQNGVNLTYVGTANGPAGDIYVGLDRFGRVVDQRWVKGTTDLERLGYGYDRDGNRLWKEYQNSTTRSEVYTYDGLNRLSGFARGTLNATKTGLTGTASRNQSWVLDAAGNWSSSTTGTTTTSRTHNRQNQSTGVGAATLTFDANGNTTKDETGKTFVYDGWNRLVQGKNGTTVLKTYGYDALGRRSKEVAGTTTTQLLYSSQWQVVEERVGTAAKVQYVWSPVYVDGLICRNRDANNKSSDGLEQRQYAIQDGNWNVTALTDTAGVVQERYAYDPYGSVTYLTGTWAARTTSSYAWVYLHQGGRQDTSTGLYHFRNRDYSPTLGRWLQQDPAGYVDGGSLYQYVRSGPVDGVDAAGLALMVSAGDNHFYPLYLGGANSQPVGHLSQPQHAAFHGYFDEVGLGYQDGNGPIARSLWKSMGDVERIDVIIKAADRAQLSGAQWESLFESMPDIMGRANPGEKTTRISDEYGPAMWPKGLNGPAVTGLTAFMAGADILSIYTQYKDWRESQHTMMYYDLMVFRDKGGEFYLMEPGWLLKFADFALLDRRRGYSWQKWYISGPMKGQRRLGICREELDRLLKERDQRIKEAMEMLRQLQNQHPGRPVFLDELS